MISVQRISLLVISGAVGLFLAVLPLVHTKLPDVLGLYQLAGDFLWIPGGLLASIVFPEGAHTGTGAAGYLPLLVLFNWIFYSGLTWVVLALVLKLRRHRHSPVQPGL